MTLYILKSVSLNPQTAETIETLELSVQDFEDRGLGFSFCKS